MKAVSYGLQLYVFLRRFFLQVNGYSNEYWGWGAEDDDMYVRILHSCLGLERAHYEVAK